MAPHSQHASQPRRPQQRPNAGTPNPRPRTIRKHPLSHTPTHQGTTTTIHNQQPTSGSRLRSQGGPEKRCLAYVIHSQRARTAASFPKRLTLGFFLPVLLENSEVRGSIFLVLTGVSWADIYTYVCDLCINVSSSSVTPAWFALFPR